MSGVTQQLTGLRLAVLYPGDATDPTVRSGTPYGVLQGLAQWGVQVVPVDVRPSAALEKYAAAALAPLHRGRGAGRPLRERFRRGYSAALVGAHLAAGRSLAGQRKLDRLQGLHGVVQLGGGYEVRTDLPRVVYDDMTVAQALRYPYVNWQAMRPRDVESRLALQRRVYRSATTCCMTSSWAAGSAEGDYGVPPGDVRVVGAGTHEEPRAGERDFSVPRFLFVGLDFTRKNGPRVLEAFARVREQHPAATLDVVGGHPPIQAPGVRTHGRIPRRDPAGRARLQELFDAATCFVMPSLYEPAGVVFTEAAAAGLPSIGGTNGGSADFIGDGGVVVEPTDTEAVVAAMLRFTDPVVAAGTGARAAARSPLFTWSALAGRLVRGLDLGGAFDAEALGLPDYLPRHPSASRSS